jgi:uncharacterized membrane protein
MNNAFGITDRVYREDQAGDQPVCCARRPQNVSDAERKGSVLAGSALVLIGLARGRLGGLTAALAGGALLYRGFTGHCYGYEALGINTAEHGPATAVPALEGEKVEKSINVQRTPEDLYRFWRNFENLPRVMPHLRSVQPIDATRSHWEADGILGRSVHWDAEVFNERENELIAWRSLPGGDVDTAGSVHFKALPHDRGTTVTVSIKYNPPAGKIGAGVASVFGEGLEQKLSEDLRHFKSIMEAGESATTVGQPSGVGPSVRAF